MTKLLPPRPFDHQPLSQGIEGAASYHDARRMRSQGREVMAAFKISDVTRALMAAQKMCLPVSGFELTPDGRIVVHTATERQGEGDADRALAEWIKKNGQG